jgi:membrane fusion protein, multidrug efflux system
MQRKRLTTAIILAAAAIGLLIFAMSASRRSPSSSEGTPDGQPSDAIAGVPASGAKGRGGPQGAPPGALDAASQAQASVKAVRVKVAAIKTLRPYIDEGGDVETSVSMSVYPEIGGKLVDVSTSVGDSVQKGQAIASVDPSKPGSSYAVSSVTAPISGVVTAVYANPGETISTGTAIAKVGVIDDLQIAVDMPERDSAKVKKGMAARISLEALPGETLAATVLRVSPVLDATSRTREATLKLDDMDERVAAGMYASVRVFTAPLAGRTVVPVQAVVTRDEESFVYVVEDKGGKKTVSKRIVKAGVSVDDEIEVKEGIAAGELVVYEGQDILSDGAEVSIVGEEAK